MALRPGRTGRPRTVEHIHGLGINPADDDLYVAAHDGLYRLTATGAPVRVAGRVQDFMGFAVIGPDRFLASGHPGSGDGRSSLGLIESSDAGQTWVTRSLSGRADFHTFASSAGSVYGYDSTSRTVMTSNDAEAWTSTDLAGVADLAADPTDPRHVLATTAQGLARSRDGARSFAAPVAPVLMLLSWTGDGAVIGVTPAGQVQTSRDGGRTWRRRGIVGGVPLALAAAGSTVDIAVSARVLISTDQGDTFSLRWQA